MNCRHAIRRAWCLAVLATLPPCVLFGADAPPVPVAATRQELWVPTKHLEEVLKKHPNAVLLDPQQYEALIRDAGRVRPVTESQPPVGTAIEDARVAIAVQPDSTGARVEYIYRLNNLRDEWCEVVLPLPVAQPKEQSRISEATALMGILQLQDLSSQKPLLVAPDGRQVRVFTQGAGRHELRLVYQVPVQLKQAGRGSLRAPAPISAADATVVSLKLPEGMVEVGEAGDRSPGERRAVATQQMGLDGNDAGAPRQAPAGSLSFFEVEWRGSAVPATPSVENKCVASTAYRFTHDRILGVCLLSMSSLTVTETGGVALLVPAGVQVLGVKKGGVSLTWKAGDGTIEIAEAGLSSSSVNLNILFEQSLDLKAEGAVPVTLPVIKPAGAGLFTAWKCSLISDPEVQLQLGNLATAGGGYGDPLDDVGMGRAADGWGAQFEPDQNARLNFAKGLRAHPGFVDAISFDGIPARAVVSVSRASDRFSVDVDALVALSAHEVSVTRTLSFHGEAGITNRSVVALPAGEAFLGASADGKEPLEWKQVGQTLELAWPQGLAAGKNSSFVIRSRQEVSPGAAAGTSSDKLTFASPQVSGASRNSGYVGLAFDESWKVNTTLTTGLESRDVSLTPVKGRMVWYGLRDWKLAFELTRREPVYDVAFTAYALPRAKQVEIEGQLTLAVMGAPLRKFDVKLPPDLAGRFRLASPLIGEQTLDEAAGIWHLTLRKELLGTANVRFRLGLPATEAGDQSLTSVLPDVQTPGARRRVSAWIVEANTDTEIEFATKGVQPLDSLRPPQVEGYIPRHRVIAAFGHTGGDYEVKLTARRHESASLAGAVAVRAKMVSVVGQDGSLRHEVTYTLRHNGRQFVAVGLPKGSLLLSTLVQDQPVKPVQAGDSQLRFPLPVLNDDADYVDVRVVYETPASPWGSWGRVALDPPVILEGVPVLTSNWTVHAPLGFSLQPQGGGLDVAEDTPRPVLLSELLSILSGGHGALPTSCETVDFLPSGVGDPGAAMLAERPEDIGSIRQIQKNASGIILPEFNLKGASLDVALENLSKLARKADPAKRGVPLRNVSGSNSNASVISLDLKNVPFIEALRYVTELAGVKYRIQPDGIQIIALTDVATEQYSRSFKLPLRAYLRLREQAGGKTAVTRFADKIDSQEIGDLLKGRDVQFPEGSRATYDSGKEMLTVRNTQPNLDQLKAVLDQVIGEPWADDDTGATAAAGAPDASGYYSEKMSKIILPVVQLNQDSIESAIEFLRIKSRDYDTVERDPDRKGVNVILKSGSTPSTAQISLDLKDVPMSEALRYITELAGMKYKIEPYAVVIVPLTDVATEQYTRTFKVSPNFLGLGVGADRTAKGILTTMGMAFPEGSSAVYLPTTGMLIVRNTGPNLDQIEAILDAETSVFNREYQGELRQASKAGLIPVALELPVTGQVLEFSGHQKAEPLTIHFVSWEWQMARTSVLVLMGALMFRVMGRSRPWRSTFLAVLLLTFLPQVVLTSWLPSCNALLLGWLVAFLLRLVWRFLRWCTPPSGTRIHSRGEAAV